MGTRISTNNHFNLEKRWIVSKYSGACSRCGEFYLENELVMWTNFKGSFHKECYLRFGVNHMQEDSETIAGDEKN